MKFQVGYNVCIETCCELAACMLESSIGYRGQNYERKSHLIRCFNAFTFLCGTGEGGICFPDYFACPEQSITAPIPLRWPWVDHTRVECRSIIWNVAVELAERCRVDNALYNESPACNIVLSLLVRVATVCCSFFFRSFILEACRYGVVHSYGVDNVRLWKQKLF